MGGSGSGTPKDLLRLDGTAIDVHGKERTSTFFEFLQLPAEHNAQLEKILTPEQALKFRNHVVRMQTGVSAIIPMLCPGPRCRVKQCPFHIEKNWLISEPCVIEANLIVNWTLSYVEDLGVDTDNRTEMILVNKLVECDIIDYRANVGFAVDEDAQTLLKSDIMDDGQRTISTLNVHPLFDIKERVQKTRMQILESLAVTRKERYKKAAALKKRDEDSIGDHFHALKKALGAAKKPVVDAEWTEG